MRKQATFFFNVVFLERQFTDKIMKVYIVWKDYDQTNIEEFETIPTAEGRLALLKNKEEQNEYGTIVLGVILGSKADLLKLPPETITKYRIQASL